MLGTPFRFEPDFTPEEFQKLGQLMLRWSTTEHVVANCLKAMLRLTDDEAIAIVFTQGLERKLQWMNQLAEMNPLKPEAAKALDELDCVLKATQYVRNNVAHAIVMEDGDGGHVFELRNKRRRLTKDQVFSAEELTNYAAHVAIYLRMTLGDKEMPGDVPPPLPGRPAVPAFLLSASPKLKNPRAA